MRLNIKYYIVVLFSAFFLNSAIAQPPNDVCSGAFSVTPDGTCYGPGLPQTTTAGSGDHWVGQVGCQTGNNNEVWFSFVATGTQIDISVTNGTQTGNIEFILVESTSPPCGGLVYEGSLCGASPLIGMVSNTLTVGATYYYTISSTGANGTFTTCVTTSTPPPAPGQDCNAAEVLCSQYDWNVGNIAAGQGTIGGNGSEEDLSTLGCLLADERRPQWYTFTVGVTGTIEFIIDPLTNSDDYDWAIYDITSSGCNLVSGGATEVACNFSGCPGNTGILNPADNACAITDYLSCANGPSCNAGDIAQFDTSPPTLTAGNTYALVVDNFSAGPNGFNFNWGSTQTFQLGQTGNFTYSLDASCMTISVTMTEYTGPNSTYFWNFGDGFTSTSSTPGSHTYGSTGTYTISCTVTDAVGCVQSFSETVDIGCVLPIKLTSFDAVYNGSTVDLDWVTSSEINNDYFTVERTTNGANFEVVAIVDGNGNSTTVNNYKSEDANPLNGKSYYRLKQTDYDGVSSVSSLKEVNVDAKIYGVEISPNPVKDNLTLSFNSYWSGGFTVDFYDVTGRLVSSQNHLSTQGQNKININTEELSPGMYLLTMSNRSGNTEKVKFIKE